MTFFFLNTANISRSYRPDFFGYFFAMPQFDFNCVRPIIMYLPEGCHPAASQIHHTSAVMPEKQLQVS